jgi:hypothetical protein
MVARGVVTVLSVLSPEEQETSNGKRWQRQGEQRQQGEQMRQQGRVQKETRENSDGRAKAKTATGAGGKGRETRDGRENRVGREEGNSNTVAKGSVNNSKGQKATGDSRGVCKKRQEKTVTDGQR